MEMITFEKAFETVMGSKLRTDSESVSLTESLYRILAQDIISDMDMPPFDKSTVDGFACRREDLGNELELIETIAAGSIPTKSISVNQCSKIMTGAAVPAGADMVFMVEDSLIMPSSKVKYTGSFTKENIAIKGEDIKNGDTILKTGKLIKAQDIAVMAAVGCDMVSVARKPAIGVISSGDELVEPSQKPGPSQIRNSNAWQLMAQIKNAGAQGNYMGIARDDEEVTYDIIKKAISENDIVLITGGVSMGDFDFVPSVLERAGVKILFSRVNVQPGKPTTFGVHSESLVFGLPGNPVSSFIQFELLVKPLICKMMGHEYNPLSFPLRMKEVFTRKTFDRMAIIPVKITDDGEVLAVEYHGSAHISSLSIADGIVTLQAGIKTIEKGEIVSVRQI